MTDFLRNDYENPKLKQSETANQLGYSSSTLQRYRNDINMLPPYRIQSNKRTEKASNTNFNNNSHRKPDVKIPQMTSIDLKTPQLSSNGKKVKTKKNLKAGSIHENEINGQFLDKMLDNNDI